MKSLAVLWGKIHTTRIAVKNHMETHRKASKGLQKEKKKKKYIYIKSLWFSFYFVFHTKAPYVCISVVKDS
jgi:hypothetical protein